MIQERLVYTTNEAEKFKRLAQKRIQELSSFCSTFLRESAVEFEMENDFEKSLDVLKGNAFFLNLKFLLIIKVRLLFLAEETIKDLNCQLEEVTKCRNELEKKIDNICSCSLCNEKFETTGERVPVKLRCTHIFCHKCAQGQFLTLICDVKVFII